jgi:hypothetical protein
VSPSELLASPSEHLTSPSELVASPSEHLTSPSELLASPSELLASPSDTLRHPSTHLHQCRRRARWRRRAHLLHETPSRKAEVRGTNPVPSTRQNLRRSKAAASNHVCLSSCRGGVKAGNVSAVRRPDPPGWVRCRLPLPHHHRLRQHPLRHRRHRCPQLSVAHAPRSSVRPSREQLSCSSLTLLSQPASHYLPSTALT